MAYSHSLSAHLIVIQERRHNVRLRFGRFDDINNLIDVVCGYFNEIEQEKYKKFVVLMKTVSVGNIINNGSSLSGILRSGQYGYQSNIVDAESGDLSYVKKKTDADMIPFYWRFFVPNHSYKGILLTQSVGPSGILELIRKIVVERFSSDYPDYKIVINPLAPEDAVKKLLKSGDVARLAFIKHTIPSDHADRLQLGSGERDGVMEVSFKPKDKTIFHKFARLTEYLNGDRSIGSVFEFEGFEYDDIKAEIQINGRKRVVSLSEPRKFKVRIDVDEEEELTKGQDGFPTFNSLNNISERIINDLSVEMGISINE
ncbi:MAG: hypothetical protein HQL98_03305 [Magnetococcales bacterium]|nr:hypothetical protein [Magnetococcales bacterium]